MYRAAYRHEEALTHKSPPAPLLLEYLCELGLDLPGDVMPPDECMGFECTWHGASAGRQPTGAGHGGPGASLGSQEPLAAETKHVTFETQHQGNQSVPSHPTSRLNYIFSLPSKQ